MTIKTAAIIGAGMAGLTAALALARRGIQVQIIEQASYLAEVGAGLQLSPNASRVLSRLGVLADLEEVWTEPVSVEMVSGRDLRKLASLPLGQSARQRWQAPYGVLHRSTLQKVLANAVANNPNCQIRLGRRLEHADKVRIEALTGVAPDLIIGADGVWSSIRNTIANAPEPDFSGNVAWRFTLSFRESPAFLNPKSVTAFLGPSTHMVAYPLAEVEAFNIVAIAAGINPGNTWDAHASAEQKRLLLQQFSGWNSEITEMLRRREDPRFWPLYQVSDGAWQDGQSTVLVGDAAHAMMPFAAQGAAMAIEDAYELAEWIASANDLPSALHAYEASRKRRASMVRRRGDFNRLAYHARGPLRVARDLILALRPPQSLAADLDWLYGHEFQSEDR
ncbi:FAD-dependent monooxygenase [Rhizobium helianthi]|uniref:FAD-dependent monooxygenase n=1 Tax=Rhizobium helianthi TaxID=1132695 RepID=A0ABW4LZ55_9HYPH